MKKSSSRGFTVIEIMTVMVIAAVITGIVISSFSQLNSSQALNTEADTILSMIERARARSVSSENASEYGINFASSSVTLFVGKSYTAGSSTNETENLNSKVKISSIALTGGASSFYFNKLSGKPSATGKVILSSVSTASTTKTITIYGTGQSDSR